MVCDACTGPAYIASNDRTTCDCAPGYYASSTAGTAAECLLCPKSSFCPGGPAESAASTSCGPGLTTISTGAASAASCITKPGFVFLAGAGSAVPCPVGTYNDGLNQKSNCTACPVGMSTAAAGASAFSMCTALPGWFYQGRIALPCPQGTYKPVLSNTNTCTRCPAGSTTRGIKAVALSNCILALAGYQISWLDHDTPRVDPCPIGTYSIGFTTDSCRPCPTDLITPNKGANSPTDCSAPPGHGFYCMSGQPTGTGPVSTDMLQAQGGSCVMPCPAGSFKAGWGLQPCISCGGNYRSNPAATSPKQCYIPAGFGSKPAWETGGGLVARKCTQGLYGVSTDVYGNTRKRPCQPCPAGMVTPDMLPEVAALDPPAKAAALDAILITSASQCLTQPGYGWQLGRSVRCGKGFYAPGYSRDPCSSCGAGLTTASKGATALSQCVALPGWQLTAPGTAEPCPTGTWSAGGLSSCQACNTSITSDLTMDQSMVSVALESRSVTDLTPDQIDYLMYKKPHRDKQCGTE